MGPAEDHVAVALARAVHRLQPTIPVAVLAVGARLSLISVGQHRLDQGPRGGGDCAGPLFGPDVTLMLRASWATPR
jgi:hypothetical protein